MDEKRFDAWTVALGEAEPTRRALLRRVGGGGLAALLAAFGVLAVEPREVAASRGRRRRRRGRRGGRGGAGGAGGAGGSGNGAGAVTPVVDPGAGDAVGDPGGSTCVPLHQTCVPLIGNPCCDANASCVVSDAGSRAGVPDFACRDTTGTCTSDAQCQGRFPNAGPDIVCGENTGGSFCPRGIAGTGRCCRRRDCSRTNPCQGGVCCGVGFITGQETCCIGDQQCTLLGCFAP